MDIKMQTFIVRVFTLAHLISGPKKKKFSVKGYRLHLYNLSFSAFDKNSISVVRNLFVFSLWRSKASIESNSKPILNNLYQFQHSLCSHYKNVQVKNSGHLTAG